MTTSAQPTEESTAEDEIREFFATEEIVGVTRSGRVTEVLEEVRTTGTYWQDEEELRWGARLAWRNTITCMGRLYWSRLIVRDRRDAATPDQVAEAAVEHLATATNAGRVRLVLTAFAPSSGQASVRILNDQLIQYAGYRGNGGRVIGDPKNVRLTALASSLGWRGTGGRWDVLPLVIQDGVQQPKWYPLPKVLEVPISHPELPWFRDMGLRWYAHPAISNLRLRIGGLDYAAAPFSAWYTVTEIAARNLSDVDRYNVLPALAKKLGLDTSSTRTLWKDRALLTLTEAVLHSFAEHGVALVDHHKAAEAFARHEDRERSAGRPVHGQWRSLVPPLAASTMRVFHRDYEPTVLPPNFFRPEKCTVEKGSRRDEPAFGNDQR